MYDLIIKNANILDGSGSDAFVSDVAIKDGKISKIGSCLSGADKVIDATGLTLTPGFIDSHSHSDRAVEKFPDQREKVEQGITFAISGQCGSSVAPSVDKEGNVRTMGDFLRENSSNAQGSGSTVLIGHGTLRNAVMGKENRFATPEELERMKELLREGMRAGAIGLSFGLIYVPGCYSNTEEVVELAKVVAEFDGILASHIRNEGDTMLEAIEEYLTVIKASGCRAVVSHHKSAGQLNWGKVRKSLAMIDKANEEGADIYVDVYPYTASGTSLTARYVPKRFHPAGTTSVLSLLDDPDVCKNIREYFRETNGNDHSGTMINQCPGFREYEGLNVNEIADLRGQADRMDTIFDLIRLTRGAVTACYFTMCEDDVEYVMKHPRAMIATDSSVTGDSTHVHPRLRGTFPRVLGRYVRERGVTTLPEMIRKMTSLPAHVYGLKTKGMIAEGMDADICIFDADKIIDQANFKDCFLPNIGLNYVIINGKVVCEDGIYNGIRTAKVYTK